MIYLALSSGNFNLKNISALRENNLTLINNYCSLFNSSFYNASYPSFSIFKAS